MDNINNNWHPIPIHCPCCGILIRLNWRSDKSAKLQCCNCGANAVLRYKGRRHIQIDTYLQKHNDGKASN